MQTPPLSLSLHRKVQFCLWTRHLPPLSPSTTIHFLLQHSLRSNGAKTTSAAILLISSGCVTSHRHHHLERDQPWPRLPPYELARYEASATQNSKAHYYQLGSRITSYRQLLNQSKHQQKHIRRNKKTIQNTLELEVRDGELCYRKTMLSQEL